MKTIRETTTTTNYTTYQRLQILSVCLTLSLVRAYDSPHATFKWRQTWPEFRGVRDDNGGMRDVSEELHPGRSQRAPSWRTPPSRSITLCARRGGSNCGRLWIFQSCTIFRDCVQCLDHTYSFEWRSHFEMAKNWTFARLWYRSCQIERPYRRDLRAGHRRIRERYQNPALVALVQPAGDHALLRCGQMSRDSFRMRYCRVFQV